MWIRTAFSTDGGATWTDTSNLAGIEDFRSTTKEGSTAYQDVMQLSSGTGYRFGVEFNGDGPFDSARCQLLVEILPDLP